MMSEAEDLWVHKPDEEVLTAAASLSDYTDEGQQIVLAEAARRGLNVTPLLRASAALQADVQGSSRRCAYCDSRIFFGGRRHGQFTFCSESCRQAGIRLAVSREIPDDVVNEHLRTVSGSACPRCGGPGPVDVHVSYRVYSVLILTVRSSRVARRASFRP